MKTTNTSDINQPLVISLIEQDLKILRLMNRLRAVEQELSAGQPDLSTMVLSHLGLDQSNEALECYLALLSKYAALDEKVYVAAPQLLQALMASAKGSGPFTCSS